VINRGRTTPASTRWILSQPTFERRLADARANRGFPQEYDLWDTNDQWNYERGRHLAVVAPANVPLRIKGKINPRAIELFDRLLLALWAIKKTITET
jgi:hypothetical protein